MAQIGTFATTASNVVVNSTERLVTISNEVVEIDGVLDPPTNFDDWGGWRIVCQNSGGFRSVSGASGTLGGGKHSLTIIEKANAYRYVDDNYNKTASTERARFYGDGTNVLKYHNIVWICEARTSRNDFDWYQGAAGNGSNGPKCELSGVSLYQLTASGSPATFNHYSSQTSIRIHPEVGYGLRVENQTNGHAFEFTHRIQDGAVVEGLVIADVTASNNNGTLNQPAARVTAQLNAVPANGTLTLSNLNTPSITDVSGSSDKTLLLIDPVGQPVVTNNWNRHCYLEIRRTIPFVFTGAAPTGETMHAINRNSGGQNATATMSGSTGSIVVRTQRTATNTALAWTDYNDYRFFMTGLGFRKYALNTDTEITNTPSTITAALTPDLLPDGSAISTITAPTNNNPPDTLSEVLRAIKDNEAANPVTSGYPITSLAYVDGNKIKINTAFNLDLNSGNDDLIYVETDPNGFGGLHIDLHTGTTLSASNGITTIDATGTGKVITLFDVTEDNDVFMLDSTGQKSVVGITNNMGSSVLFSVVDTADGDIEGSATIANGATGNVSIATKGLSSTYNVVGKRVGYDYFSSAADLSSGGLVSVTAPAQRQIVQPSGSASYVSTVSVPNTLTTAFSHSGSTPAARLECGDATFSARQLFKSYEDEMATADGAAYMGLGGAQMTYIESALKGNEVVLGAHTKAKRKATTDSNATIRATLYAPDDAPIDDSNGDVQTIEGLDIPAVATEIWSSSTRTLTSGGGGGGSVDIDPDDIWGYREIIQTYTPSSLTDGDLVLPGNQENDFATGDPVRLVNNGGYTGADNGADLWARNAGAAIQLFRDRATAIAGTQNARVRLTGTGTAGNIRLARLTTTAIDRINSIPADVWGAGTRTLTTSAAPSATAIADEVWSRRYLSTTIIPSSVDSGIIVFDADDRVLVPNLTAVRITNLGGYTGPNTTDTYIVADDGAGRRPLYRTRDEALDNQIGDRIAFTGAGTAGLIRVDVLSPVAIEMTYDIHDNTSEIPQDVWLYATRELTNTSSLATSVATGVWARPNRTLTSTDNIWSNSNALTNTGIADAVWSETERTLTAADNLTDDIADAVWDEEITIVGNTTATITPDLTINQNISLSSSDAVGITNGQVVRVTNTGGFTGWQTGVDYYAHVGGTILNLYETESQSLVGGNDGLVYPGGIDTNRVVTLTTTRQAITRNLGQARDVIEAILLDTEAVLPAPTAEQITTAVWSADDRTITGGVAVPSESEIATAVSNIAVENGLTLKQAMQIISAVAAGRLTIDSNGTTYTYRRLDSSSTPVIRSEVGDSGRGDPTRDPT